MKDGEIETLAKIRRCRPTATFAFWLKWTESSRAGQAHLRQNELPRGIFPQTFEEVQELLFANLISQKLQEEVALREKRERANLHSQNIPDIPEDSGFELSDVPSDSAPAWGFFWVEGMFHYWRTRLLTSPVFSLLGLCANTQTICNTQTPHESDCGIVRQSAASTALCIGILLTSAYIKTS